MAKPALSLLATTVVGRGMDTKLPAAPPKPSVAVIVPPAKFGLTLMRSSDEAPAPVVCWQMKRSPCAAVLGKVVPSRSAVVKDSPPAYNAMGAASVVAVGSPASIL